MGLLRVVSQLRDVTARIVGVVQVLKSLSSGIRSGLVGDELIEPEALRVVEVAGKDVVCVVRALTLPPASYS